MASERRKMCGDIGFWAKTGLMVTAWATARRTMWVAPKRVRRSLRAPTNIGRGSWFAIPCSPNKAASARARS